MRYHGLLFAVLLFTAGASAYNPPADTAGPITVQIQSPAIGAYGAGGYDELSRPGVPLTGHGLKRIGMVLDGVVRTST